MIDCELEKKANADAVASQQVKDHHSFDFTTLEHDVHIFCFDVFELSAICLAPRKCNRVSFARNAPLDANEAFYFQATTFVSHASSFGADDSIQCLDPAFL